MLLRVERDGEAVGVVLLTPGKTEVNTNDQQLREVMEKMERTGVLERAGGKNKNAMLEYARHVPLGPESVGLLESALRNIGLDVVIPELEKTSKAYAQPNGIRRFFDEHGLPLPSLTGAAYAIDLVLNPDGTERSRSVEWFTPEGQRGGIVTPGLFPGTANLFDPEGQRTGTVKAGPLGVGADVFDPSGRRVAAAKPGPLGQTVDLFDPQTGRRIGWMQGYAQNAEGGETR